MSIIPTPPALQELLTAGKSRWGNEHLVVGEKFDGILTPSWLFAERGDGTKTIAGRAMRVSMRNW